MNYCGTDHSIDYWIEWKRFISAILLITYPNLQLLFRNDITQVLVYFREFTYVGHPFAKRTYPATIAGMSYSFNINNDYAFPSLRAVRIQYF